MSPAGEGAGKEESRSPSTNQNQQAEGKTLKEGADEDTSVEQDETGLDDANGKNEDDHERVIELKRVSWRHVSSSEKNTLLSRRGNSPLARPYR